MSQNFDVVEASIAQLRHGLETGQVTSQELVRSYQARLAAYDSSGPQLNSVVVVNPDALAEASASDQRRARGQLLGPLDGIPYTVKDSFMAAGLSVAAGSPAFAQLIAQHDSFTVGALRAGGAILLGLTNMPPMADGGMQRGLYGRAESPYCADYLTSAFGSGSSNGSGTATAASFAAFGLGEETWSSGRAPASNNGLCAYTPSWGLLSIRGNWPLVPTMDVVVPHTRSMADMFEVLEVIMTPDTQSRGDFWRSQPWIDIPAVEEVRPASFSEFTAQISTADLNGLRVGAPAMFLGEDSLAGTAQNPGIGGATGQPIRPRASVLHLWQQAVAELENFGARVELTDLPVVSNYEGDRPGSPTIFNRGVVPEEYLEYETAELSAWAWDDFLRSNGDPKLNRLADVDGEKIFPHEPGTLADRAEGFSDIAAYPALSRALEGVTEVADMPLAQGLEALVATRDQDFTQWMDQLGLDVLAFPTVADVAPFDAERNIESADIAWRNGVWVANGNLVWRHLGIPTVTVPMGIMSDTGMPVGLTFAGRAYEDLRLLRFAAAFESIRQRRSEPPLTPQLSRGVACTGVS